MVAIQERARCEWTPDEPPFNHREFGRPARWAHAVAAETYICDEHLPAFEREEEEARQNGRTNGRKHSTVVERPRATAPSSSLGDGRSAMRARLSAGVAVVKSLTRSAALCYAAAVRFLTLELAGTP